MNQPNHSAYSFVFKSDRPWPNPRLKVAAIVGHTTSDTARLWFRTGQLGDFSLFLYLRGETLQTHGNDVSAFRTALSVVPMSTEDVEAILGQQIVHQEDFTIADYANDTTHVVNLEGLSADTTYGYVLYSHDRPGIVLGQNRLRQFRTPPSEDEKRPFQFAVFSCHKPYKAKTWIWEDKTVNLDMLQFLNATLQRHRREVDLVIAGGDQCYCDGVHTLDIWEFLNKNMCRRDGNLLPVYQDMLSWYRDIYRGYWGFESLQKVFDEFPTYMIWDDHEICDGWGSHYLESDPGDALQQMLPDLRERGLNHEDGLELVHRMFQAARKAYIEYQHSHNPDTADGTYDYAFRRGGCAFYVLDGRGQRNIDNDDYRILGVDQYERFREWANRLDPEDTRFVFVVSAVPVLHTRTAIVNLDEWLGGLGDDLRDSWEHELHDDERRVLMDTLFMVTKKGIKVAVVSGDVHISAAFSLEDNDGNRIYQLTSSAITADTGRLASLLMRGGVSDEGQTAEGYHFRRLALYADNSYALISVNPRTDEAWFKLYGKQFLDAPPDVQGHAEPLSHSLAKIPLV